ncbi:MAG TPA: class I SAM-dependent methyltransferase [Trueperaceae bacterium]|nr:class I SAM-dependent methyltransferase [Trueperaceae bacterium]
MQPKPFTALAEVYDAIMADVEYDAWTDFILRLARARGLVEGPLLDLGCGTGNATAPMVERGLEVVGVDASEAMLAVARRKLPRVRFHRADFRRLRVPGRFGLVYSVFDALNNLLEPSDFEAMARHVHRLLLPGGLFVFDMNTTVGLRDLWEGGRAEGWAGDVYYRWVHSYDEATGLARVEAFCESETGAFTEVHFERPYDPPELRTLLAAAGFEGVEAVSYASGRPAPPDAARVWVVARRPPAPP